MARGEPRYTDDGQITRGLPNRSWNFTPKATDMRQQLWQVFCFLFFVFCFSTATRHCFGSLQISVSVLKSSRLKAKNDALSFLDRLYLSKESTVVACFSHKSGVWVVRPPQSLPGPLWKIRK